MPNGNTYFKTPYIDFNRGIIYRVNKKTLELVKVGNERPDGYLMFRLEGKTVLVHRYLYEKYYNVKLNPDEIINHKNHKKDDNRIENLEVVCKQQNCQYRENALGYYWNNQKKKWQANIMLNQKTIYLGRFDKEQDARNAYIEKARYLNENHNCKFNV
jgi:hypothetical protein